MNTFKHNEYTIKFCDYVNDIFKEKLNCSIESLVEDYGLYFSDLKSRNIIYTYDYEYYIENTLFQNEFAVCFQYKVNNSKKIITFHVSVGNRDCRFMYYHNLRKKWIIDEDLIHKNNAENIIKFLTQKTDFKNKLEEKLINNNKKEKRSKI